MMVARVSLSVRAIRRFVVRRPAALFLAASLVAATLGAAPPGTAARAEEELPLPRFASLRAQEVNLRTGPGTSYPVDWVYRRRDMPVEIIAVFDTWRKIRDWQGTVGWVHQSMLAGRRTGVVVGTAEQHLLGGPEEEARTLARLGSGVIVRLQACDPAWCRVEVKGHRGWLRRDAFWGVYPGETLD